MSAPPRPRALSFRHALAIAAALIMAGLAAMAALAAAALGEADRLLDRLSRSQDQLARVTRIEAGIDALVLEAYRGGEGLQAEAADIAAQLDAYVQTIEAERAVISAEAGAQARQAEEARQGEALAALAGELAAELARLRDQPGPGADVDDRRARLQALTRAIAAQESAEGEAAIAAMRDLQTRTMMSAAALLCLAGAAGLAGGWAMQRNMARPLHALERAARRVGAGTAPPAPVTPSGFSEIRHVAGAFNRLEEEVDAQRRALAEHNRNLEAEVAERTREIEESRARLAEIDRTRRLFVSRVSHELRTPATVIRGEAEVALRDPDASATDLRDALEHVAANSAFLQRRLDDLLSLGRAEDGQVRLQTAPVRLNDLVDEVAALAEPYLRSSGMSLTAQGPEGPPLTISGDASWLKQALLAAIDNAAKFGSGGQAVRLELRRDGAAAVIGVADGGTGAPAEALPRLFDAYYRGPDTESARGAGLGLSVAKWVAEQHGGAVAAHNEEGQGLVIELRLPLET